MTSHFHRYAAAGFLPYIVPLIPVGAQLTALSRIKPTALGKIPGQYVGGGKWRGFPKWTGRATTMAEIDEWATWPGAGLGLRTGQLVAIDVDVMNEKLSFAIGKQLHIQLGEAPVRVGRKPKHLSLYRLDDGEPEFGKLTTTLQGPDGVAHGIEVLAAGQHFVAEGIHPKTKAPYEWNYFHPCELGFAKLPRIKSHFFGVSFANALLPPATPLAITPPASETALPAPP